MYKYKLYKEIAEELIATILPQCIQIIYLYTQ